VYQVTSHEAPVQQGRDPPQGVMIDGQILHHQGSDLGEVKTSHVLAQIKAGIDH
jgi:hypothetical protein